MSDFNKIYHVFKDFGIIFDERKNSFGTLRKVQWVSAGADPDPNKAKLELRHIIAKDEGEELGKGYAFSTEEGPHELAEGLVHIGFGNTKNLLKSLIKREDFKDSIDNINNDPDDNNDDSEMFDMRSLMSMIDDEED